MGVAEAPEEMYGKTMSIPDSSLEPWYRLLLGREPPADLGPRDAKRALARALVDRFHGPGAGAAAEAAFDQIDVRHGVPDDMPEVQWQRNGSQIHLPALLAQAFGSRPRRRGAISPAAV